MAPVPVLHAFSSFLLCGPLAILTGAIFLADSMPKKEPWNPKNGKWEENGAPPSLLFSSIALHYLPSFLPFFLQFTPSPHPPSCLFGSGTRVRIQAGNSGRNFNKF